MLLLVAGCTSRPAVTQSATGPAPSASTGPTAASAVPTAPTTPGGSTPSLPPSLSGAGPSGQSSGQPTDPPQTTTSTPSALGVTAFFDSIDNTVTLAGPRPKVVIDLFTDPMCVDCARLQEKDGPRLLAAVEAGILAIKFHFMTIQDPQSASGDYSTRAVGVLLCAAAYEPLGSTTFLNLYRAIFDPAYQPVQHAAYDHRQSELVELAQRANADQRVLLCVGGTEGKSMAAQSQASAGDALSAVDGAGIPTVLAGGKRVTLSGDWLTKVFLGVAE